MIYSEIDGIKSSKIILGRDCTSKALDKKVFFRGMDVYAANGGNHLDTAHLYCGGESEKLVGEWIKTKKRDDFIITTKGAHFNELPEKTRFTKTEIEKDLDESLKRLSLDYVDIYMLHRDDIRVPAAVVIDILNEFVKKGKIKKFGCSNWRAGRIEEANGYAAKSNQNGFCISQIKTSLGITAPTYEDKTGLVEMDNTEYEYYKEKAMPVSAFASQAKGFFQKIEENLISEKCRERYYCGENLSRFDRAKRLADEKNVSITAVVLSYLYSQETDVFPIIGGSSAEQIADSMKYSDFLLTKEELKYLEG